MTRDLNGPWLTLAETSQKTGFVKNEILFSIHTGGVMPVVYSHNRPFLAISRSTDGKITGHATFHYSGPIGVDKTVIDDIVVQNKTIVGQRPIRLLLPDNVFDWNSAYPYEGQAPSGILSNWQPRPEVDTALIDKPVLHLPQEHSCYEWAESSLVEHVPDNFDEDKFFERYAGQYLIRSPVAKYVYGTDYNSVYTQKDLRIPASALPNLGKPINNSEQKETKTNKITLSQKQRSNDLHLVIIRVLETYPDAKSGFLWNELRRDSQSENRQFDSDELIHKMDCTQISWTSNRGVTQIFKKTSFQTLVSRLRKQRKS